MGRGAEAEQSRLFPAPLSEPTTPVEFGEYDQLGFSLETEKPRELTIENCVVQSLPTVQTVQKGVKEWRCGFSAPADLWHQDRDELIEVRTSTQETVALATSKRLKPGDMVTITGLITQQQLLVTGVKVTQLTYLNVTDILVGLRAAKTPVFVKRG